MIRLMGDAIGVNAGKIPQTVQLIAPYITGLNGVEWTQSDLDLFPGIPHVTIDQGAGNAPRYDANIIDIETGAWTVNHVTGWINNATAPRPTVYVNQGNEWGACLAALASPRFKGDVWLAFPGWQPGQPLPPLPAGCQYVAVQNITTTDYDLSDVIDDDWPQVKKGKDMLIIGATGVPEIYLLSGGKMSHITDQTAFQALEAVGIQQATVTPACLTQFLTDFPPGPPTATINAEVKFPSYLATPQ